LKCVKKRAAREEGGGEENNACKKKKSVIIDCVPRVRKMHLVITECFIIYPQFGI
jgi:hypothetical protein